MVNPQVFKQWQSTIMQREAHIDARSEKTGQSRYIKAMLPLCS